MQYRLKQIEVEAFHFNGEALIALPTWAQKHRSNHPLNGNIGISRNLVGTLLVPVHGQHIQCAPGDYLVFDGTELSVVKARDFVKLYEPVVVEPAPEAAATPVATTAGDAATA